MSVVKAKNGKWHKEVFWISHGYGAIRVNGVLMTGDIRLGGIQCRTSIHVTERYDGELPPQLPTKDNWCTNCFGRLSSDQKLLLLMMQQNEV